MRMFILTERSADMARRRIAWVSGVLTESSLPLKPHGGQAQSEPYREASLFTTFYKDLRMLDNSE